MSEARVQSDFSSIETSEEDRFLLNIEGYEGPLDVLLAMARTQKVDLREIDILALSETYLAFVRSAKEMRIELAADYLVMAAWLTYLKSRLLLPKEENSDEEDPEILADRLQWQLERLSAMREASSKLMARDRLYTIRFPRGISDEMTQKRVYRYHANLYDLLTAYARVKTREDFVPLHFERIQILSMEEALERMRNILGTWQDWRSLADFLPSEWRDEPQKIRSALAAHFSAILQLSKEGQVEIKQNEHFQDIKIRGQHHE